ncbi:ParB/RepB/Spo0J family partition protein [Streptomyces sp. NPDC059247]|uniref:ParB/RepB/Spo0J family partition protein n=1 Tax=Streptomyces sp. NPDC059247 TaxID=3346790 RepID=UPI0036AC4548
MSKTDTLRASSSFERARPVSARRAAINEATSAPTEGVAAPTKLPPRAISLNPDNPRSELGDLSELAGSLRDHGQKTAISLVTRFAYLEANPGREADLEAGTSYVAIDGNSRLAAAREVGLKTLKVMVDDGLGADPASLLESALVANVHRKDLDPLDEAKVLAELLKIHGSQENLAKRLNKSQGWVSQRLALLKLTPELKERLQSGEEQAKHLRAVGNKKPAEQEAALAALKEKEATQKKAEKQAREALRAQKADASGAQADPETPHYPVMDTGHSVPEPRTVDPVPTASAEDDSRAAASPSTQVAGAAASGEPSGKAGEGQTAVQLRASDHLMLMDTARSSLNAAEFSGFLQRYFRITSGVEEVAEDLGRGLPADARNGLAEILRSVADRLGQGS